MTKLQLKKKPTPPMTELVPPNDPSLPPAPAHIGKPVGPPPAPVELPRTYDECMEVARKAANGQIEKAHLWAYLAQAHATKELADKIDALNEFLGVYDEVDEEDRDDGEAPLNPRFADVIGEGLLGAVSVVKDDLMASPLMQLLMASAMRGAAESASETGGGQSE